MHSTQNICPKCYQLPATDSPLQVESFGEIRSRSFTVIGCKRLRTNRVSWFEWLLNFSDSEIGWIKESQGIWRLFSFETPSEQAITFDPQSLAVGDIFSYDQRRLVLKSLHWSHLVFQNGEALLKAWVGDKNLVLEAEELSPEGINPSPKLYHFEFPQNVPEQRPPIISLGVQIEFTDLNAQNLRTLAGGSRIQKIVCPGCSGSFIVRYNSFSLRAVCHSCYHIIDISTDDHMSLKQFDLKQKFNPLISIGSTGKIQGDAFEVIGCLRLLDKKQLNLEFTKYLLFSPTKSYRWLNNDHGHWTICRAVYDLNKKANTLPIKYRGQKYIYDHTSEQRLVFALGEFFWPIQKDEIFEGKHFISAPYSLSFEQVNSASEIYLGRYLSPHQITSAFKLIKTLPAPLGAVPHEVSPFHHLVKEFIIINLVFSAVCLLIQLRSLQSNESSAHHSHIHFASNSDDRTQSTEPFELRDGPKALAVSVASATSKSTLLEVSLIEIRSRTKHSFSLRSTGKPELIPHLPGGIYLLSFTTGGSKENLNFDVNAAYGVKSWSNFVFFISLMSLPSFLILTVNRVFVFKRSRKRKLNNGAL